MAEKKVDLSGLPGYYALCEFLTFVGRCGLIPDEVDKSPCMAAELDALATYAAEQQAGRERAERDTEEVCEENNKIKALVIRQETEIERLRELARVAELQRLATDDTLNQAADCYRLWRERAEKAEAALMGLCRGKSIFYPKGCWCEVAIGNPNLGGRHSAACLAAQAALHWEKPDAR